jgi:hypothetical protein
LTVTINNYAIPKSGTKVKIDTNTKIVISELKFESAEEYNKVSSNKVIFKLTNQGNATKVRIGVIKGDDKGDLEKFIYKTTGGTGYIALKDIGSTKGFELDFVDDDGKFKMDSGTYKITFTPLDDSLKATARACVITFKFTKGKGFVVKPVDTLNFGKGGTGATASLKADGCRSVNIIYGSIRLGVAASGCQVIKSVNVNGKMNKFANNFKIENGELKFTGGANPKLDPSDKNMKNEFQGYIGYSCRSQDGELHYKYYKVTVKLDKGAVLGQ